MQLLKVQILKIGKLEKNTPLYPISLNYLNGLIFQNHKYQIKKCSFLPMRGLRIKGVQGFRKVAGRGWCRELYIFFKALRKELEIH